MTLQQLEYIVAVDKYRHFAKAAESCNVTQSTLSALIQKLEQELDLQIFDRKSHPVKPTAVGEAVIRQARVVLFNASQLHEMVLAEREKECGEIRLGVASTVAPYVLPKLFSELEARHPQVRLKAEEGRMDALVRKLERAELDVALLPTPVGREQLLEIPVYRERLLAYVSRGSSLYAAEALEADHLPADKLWVLQEEYCPKGGLFAFCARQSGNASLYKAGNAGTLVEIVDACGGYTILPELHVPLLSEERRLQVRPIRCPEPRREVSLVIRRDYVQQRLLNILADSLKLVIPEALLDGRIKKFSIVI